MKRYGLQRESGAGGNGLRPGLALAIGLLASAFSGQAGAADSLTELDFLGDVPVVLTASRLSQPLGETPAAVTVIDQEMIRASGFRDIPDLFRLVPGFTVAYTNGNTWGVGYHGMGDAYSRRMQVLIDGRSVYTPGFGEVPWASLPLSIDDIDHIEVVRGPNSAAYGSNAFFGVINIITKEPSQAQGVFASAQYGEQGMAGATLRYGGGEAGWRYRLTLSDQKRDRFANQAERTDTRHLDFRGDYQLSGTDEITTVLALSRADWRTGFVGKLSDPVREPDVAADHVQVRFHRTVDEDTDWSLQFYHIHNKTDDPFVVLGFPVNDGAIQWRSDLEFQATSRLSDQMRLVWGAEARREAVKSPLYFYNQDTRTGTLYRLFGNMEWQPAEPWTVNGGVMAEHHYLTGLDLAPRLAVNYRLNANHAFRASISQAYRSPTFFEKDGRTPPLVNPGFIPTSSIDPERILSREIGYFGHIPGLRLQIDARLFDDSVSGIIGTPSLPPGPKIFHFYNKNWADIRGADIQVRWKPADFAELVLSYAHVNINSSNNDIAVSTPRNNFSGLAIFRLPDNWEASAGVYQEGYMKWLDDGDAVRAFTRVDARLAKRFSLGGHPAEVAVVGQDLGADYAEFRSVYPKDNIFTKRVYGSLSLAW